MNKNTILMENDLFGPITITDLINHFDILIKQNKLNQDILDSILRNSSELEEPEIVSILNKFDFDYALNFLKDIFEKLD